ncbi:MAG: GDSL-type esterase/lipase family protein [Solidesulfovibrio sp. DCME]|uniref:SGNH/GDSL hydrolase family protein n=1 Tax=Solidesulfovibrio sp. DCME TaxID=3447380 RepID=UPI003D107614
MVLSCLAAGPCLAKKSQTPPDAAKTDQGKAAPAKTDSGKTDPTPALRAPGPAADAATRPRKILLVGDSFAVGLGLTLPQSMGRPGDVALLPRGKVSSGLNSPQFYDWEKALAEFLEAEKPDALVVMLGGNDAKNGRGTPQWAQDFTAKAGRFLDIAGRHGVRVYWVGLPPMREKAFSQRAWTTNEAMRAACTGAPSCRFIESWDLFADTSGRFCAKKTVSGKAISLRGKDGVHFTTAGCRLLTDRIVTAMATPR